MTVKIKDLLLLIGQLLLLDGWSIEQPGLIDDHLAELRASLELMDFNARLLCPWLHPSLTGLPSA